MNKNPVHLLQESDSSLRKIIMSDEENSLTQRDNFVPQRPRNYEKSIKRSQTELFKSDKGTQAGVIYVSKLTEEFDDITPIRPEEQLNQHSFDISSIFDEPQYDRANHIDANLMDKISELQNYAKDLQREILDQEKVIELQQQQLKVLKSTLSGSEGKYHKVHYTIRGEDPTANVGHIKEVILRLFKQLPPQ